MFSEKTVSSYKKTIHKYVGMEKNQIWKVNLISPLTVGFMLYHPEIRINMFTHTMETHFIREKPSN